MNSKKQNNLFVKSFENPLSQLGENERREVLAKIAKEQGDLYNSNLTKIEAIIRSVNPLDVLAHYAYYDLLVLDHLRNGKESRDELLQQHNVEFLQALYLSIPCDDVSFEPLRPEQIGELSECLQSIAPAFSLRRIADKRPDTAVVSIELMRMHTQTIRNRGYPDQILKFLSEVFAPLDTEMAKVSGVKPSLLVAMVIGIMEKAQDSANQSFRALNPLRAAKTVEEAVRNYYKILPGDQDVQRMLDLCAKRGWNLLETKSVLLSHYELELWRTYKFSLADFVKAYPEPVGEDSIRAVLSLWSFGFGDLANHIKEHFFLDNPIWNRPIVRVGEDSYFWPLPQMFLSFGLEMIEALVDLYPNLKSQYEGVIRPRYLEDEAERVFRGAFPQAVIHRGSLWHDPLTGKEFENDMLVTLDSFMFVVECKSGAIPPSARRGGQRLEVAVRKLITEPAEQSARFAEYLLANRRLHKFSTKRGATNNCDTTNVHHVIRLSLTIDFFGPLTSMSRLLAREGILETHSPIAVTMPIVILETVFELLEGVHQKLHYLSRRSEWESHVDGMADEYDLLVFYMETGFNVGKFEFEGKEALFLYGLSEKLDAYFRGQILGKLVAKPTLRLTQWWRTILDQTEKKAFKGWTEVGLFLLSASRPDQWSFEKAAKKLEKNVLSKWRNKGHENFILYATGPKQRRTAICAYAFKDHISRQKRDEDMQKLFSRVLHETGCKDVLVIGLNVDKRSYPYQFLSMAFDVGVDSRGGVTE